MFCTSFWKTLKQILSVLWIFEKGVANYAEIWYTKNKISV